MTIFLTGFLRVFVFSLALIQVADGDSASIKENLTQRVGEATKQVEYAALRRPFKLTGMNDSLQKTAEATHAMREGRSAEKTLRFIDQALKAYPENKFALLLRALIVDERGGPEKGNKAFEDFLLKSRTFGEFEKKFLKWREFHGFRQSVFELLKKRGISFEGREETIQVKIPFERFFEFLVRPEPQDVFLSFLLIGLTVGGGLLLIVLSMSGVSFQGRFLGSLLSFYIYAWIAYAIWIADLMSGLPFGLTRHVVVPWLLGGSAGYFILAGFFSLWRERTRPPAEGYKRCPKCRKIVLELATECEYCEEKFLN